MVVLEDILKPGIAERFERLRRMGLRTVMVTGDNPLTAKAIAQQAGVDDFIAEATPEAKLAYIRKEQAGGKLVAMMGDGTNDAPALAQADVGVAMNSGTQAAKEAGNMVDLDSDPTKLIETVEIGKQLLMTRGSLTTFSIANDLAKYFAIVPAMFAGHAAVAEAAGHHAPALGHLGDPFRGDFQCNHHPAVDPHRAEGREVSPRRGRRPAPPQSPGVGPGRRGRAVYRHQDHRHDPRGDEFGGVKNDLELRALSLQASSRTIPNQPHEAISMFQHLRACLWLLLSVLLCCVIYPAVLWGLGQDAALLSAGRRQLDRADNGKTVGSRLIGQPFTAEKCFQPRPSATTPAYNAAASGATNWAANNYLLRDRVAGNWARSSSYKRGGLVGPDIDSWFQADKTAEGPPASWPNGPSCILRLLKIGSRPTISTRPTSPTGRSRTRRP